MLVELPREKGQMARTASEKAVLGEDGDGVYEEDRH
jgi:hypothetical protein